MLLIAFILFGLWCGRKKPNSEILFSHLHKQIQSINNKGLILFFIKILIFNYISKLNYHLLKRNSIQI